MCFEIPYICHVVILYLLGPGKFKIYTTWHISDLIFHKYLLFEKIKSLPDCL